MQGKCTSGSDCKFLHPIEFEDASFRAKFIVEKQYKPVVSSQGGGAAAPMHFQRIKTMVCIPWLCGQFNGESLALLEPQGKAGPYWHESVELYQVLDSHTKLEVGYFYLDLYPREGKYSHAACFPFITKSEHVLPVATMACNFNKGNLNFDEVETFFHEFGHVMHHLSSESTINSTAAFSCEHDFVETPSQMFEEWCYAKETLQMMSDNLPDELVEKLNLSRKLLQGYHYARQLLFGHYDMFIHSSKYVKSGLKPKQVFDFLHKEILELDSSPTTSEPANFGHLMGGYDAGYYGYAWSLVYAKDLFSEFKKNGMLNSELGMKLRKEVLSKGSIRKSLDSIIKFLGREPSNDEFIESIC